MNSNEIEVIKKLYSSTTYKERNCIANLLTKAINLINDSECGTYRLEKYESTIIHMVSNMVGVTNKTIFISNEDGMQLLILKPLNDDIKDKTIENFYL